MCMKHLISARHSLIHACCPLRANSLPHSVADAAGARAPGWATRSGWEVLHQSQDSSPREEDALTLGIRVLLCCVITDVFGVDDDSCSWMYCGMYFIVTN
jgi:hypothetical protein